MVELSTFGTMYVNSASLVKINVHGYDGDLDKTKLQEYDGYAVTISDEVARATAAEGVNAAAITALGTSAAADLAAEVAARTAADSTHTTAIADEVTRATAAEAANTSAIAAESARAIAAEGANAAAILAETTLATANAADIDVLEARWTGDDLLVAGLLTAQGNVSIGGNLQVNGTTTTVNTQQVSLNDSFLQLNTPADGTAEVAVMGGVAQKLHQAANLTDYTRWQGIFFDNTTGENSDSIHIGNATSANPGDVEFEWGNSLNDEECAVHASSFVASGAMSADSMSAASMTASAAMSADTVEIGQRFRLKVVGDELQFETRASTSVEWTNATTVCAFAA